jgi:hypothetical protein
LKFEIETSDVHIEHIVVLLWRNGIERRERPDTCIQKGAIKLVYMLFNISAQRQRRIQVACVRGEYNCVRHDFPGCGQSVRIAPGDDDFSAVRDQKLSGGKSDTGGAPGDEDRFVLHWFSN